MTECSLRKARTYKHVVVDRRGRFMEVEDIVKWGKNWEIRLVGGDSFVAASTYQGLFRVTGSELVKLTNLP